MKIIVIFAVTIIAGQTLSSGLSAQPPPPPPPPDSLKQVPVPEPDDLRKYIYNKTAAIALGKSLFWDMQVGSDGIQSCASCHFNAGADSRSKNQINPDLLRVNAERKPDADKIFSTGGGPNYQLKSEDYPFHKLENPDDRASTVVSDSNDITSSQGVFKAEFLDVVPGKAEDKVKYQPDDVFNVQGTEVRRVEPRNTPTTINAVFNFRNFWDGRAQDVFNGVNPFGLRDSKAFVLKATRPNKLRQEQVKINNSSLASQAVGPPTSEFEQGSIGRPFLVQQAARTRVAPDQELGEGSRIGPQLETLNPLFNENAPKPLTPKKIGKKMLSLRPLGKQLVHRQDSVLGPLSRQGGILGPFNKAPRPGLRVSYSSLIQAAFKPEWWNSNLVISFDNNNNGTIISRPNRPLTTNEVTLMEYNFSLFFGLAIQAYESTLVSDNTPFDQFRQGNTSALTAQQQEGLNLFLSSGCIGCHAGAEFTAASVANVRNNGRITRLPPTLGNLVQDTGFFNIGVRPPLEDLGVGGNDGLDPSRPLSEARLAQQGEFQEIFGEAPNISVGPNDPVVADGFFKAPGLRNVELTAPYMHNGGQLTLRQVVDFYSRGAGDDDPKTPRTRVLNLNEAQKEALVAFMRGLTDERVRNQSAPFDHPQLFIPDGHPGDQNSVTDDGTGKAKDTLVEIPAVGRNGGKPLPSFLTEAP